MDTSHPITVLRRMLADDRRRLREAVDLVPANRRGERPAADRWSVAEVLEHLAIVEERSVGVLTQLAANAPMRSPGELPAPTALDRTALRDRSRGFSAPEVIQPTGTQRADEAWARLERSRLALDTALTTLADRDLSTVTRVHPALGQIDGYQSIAAIGGHEERHAAQIRDIARALAS